MNAGRMVWLPGLMAVIAAVAVLGADQRSVVHRPSLDLTESPRSSNFVVDDGTVVVPGSREVYGHIRGLMDDLEPEQVVAQLAQYFLGTPYAAFSLDEGGSERLRIDLRNFDCMLFVEQLLALGMSSSWDSFVASTRLLRYREGRVDYCSRNHYFQNWAQSAVDQRFVVDLTKKLPGYKQRGLKLRYMSSNPSLYAPLSDAARFSCIQDNEFHSKVVQDYLPTQRLREASAYLRSGDLFAVVTSVPGLDVTHMGVVIIDASGPIAIHAVPGRGVIRSASLASYVQSVPQAIGVVVLRPQSRKVGVYEQPGS